MIKFCADKSNSHEAYGHDLVSGECEGTTLML